MKNVIVDGNNYIMIAMAVAIRSGNINITSSILLSMIKKLKKWFGEFSNYYVCFDTRGGTKFRKELNPEYKATRTYDPEKINAIESCKSVFDDNNFLNCTLQTCEADDAIFSLCKSLTKIRPKDENIVVSRDHDMIQIVQAGYSSCVWDPCKKNNMIIPEYSIVKMKALTGDSSDNIIGLKGVGTKTALKIINEEKIMTDEQKEIYERNLKVIDARLNPSYNDNCNKILEKLKVFFKLTEINNVFND